MRHRAELDMVARLAEENGFTLSEPNPNPNIPLDVYICKFNPSAHWWGFVISSMHSDYNKFFEFMMGSIFYGKVNSRNLGPMLDGMGVHYDYITTYDLNELERSNNRFYNLRTGNVY